MENFLLATDGSPHALAAARFLANFARQHGRIAVQLLHVEEPPEEWQTHGLAREAIAEHRRARADEILQRTAAELGDAPLDCQQHYVIGEPAACIVAQAAALGCSQIVMGSRGLGALRGLACGSVSQGVLHQASLPVTCIKAGAAQS